MKIIANNQLPQMQINRKQKSKHPILLLLFFTLFLLFLTVPGQAKTPEWKMVDGNPSNTVQAPTSGAKADTFIIYGGPGTLEGKFQTADMQPDPQGWYSEDLTAPSITEGDRWMIETFNCENLDPGNPDNHAYWAGDFYTPCPDDPEDLAGGYGNNMDAALGWQGEVPDPSSAVTVNVTYIINYETEAGYDFVHFEVYNASTETWENVLSYDGMAMGWVEDLTFTVEPEFYQDGNMLNVRFHVTSDGIVSGADCEYGFSSDGAAQIDNVAVFFDQGSGFVQIGSTETFEPDKDVAWNPIIPGTPVGNFGQVWPLLNEAGTTLNETPRWSFIDDGEVVPELPGYTNGFDYGPGGFCVNAAGGLAGPGNFIYNMVRSPVIYLPAGPYQNVIFTYDEYRHQVMGGGGLMPVFTCAEVRSTADPSGQSGWSDWLSSGSLYYGGPGSFSVDFPLMDRLVEDAAAIQVSFGVRQVDWWGDPDPYSSPAPYYDNARVKFIPASSEIPEMLPEPEYTRDTNNWVECSDTSMMGSVAYYLECATDPGFTNMVANSGWIDVTSYNFTELTHNQIYYYRARARDEFNVESDFSEAVFSTQDAVVPESNVTEMDEYQGTSFQVPYAATDDGSGVRLIRLWYNYNGGAFQEVGYFLYSETEPWIDFTATDGEGTYGFYTNARDFAGNYEENPDLPPDESVIVQAVSLEAPSFVAEPEFTQGLSNIVSWSDESGSGATVYYAECATDEEFTSVVAATDWIADTTFNFAGLTDGQIYYYRVMSGDGDSLQSGWSDFVFSTQDASPPISSADELPPVQGTVEFDVAFTASDESSGVSYVSLMFNVDGGQYTMFGSATESPIAFIADGDGTYGFYTIATDSVGNQEAIPDTPPDTETIVDTIASAAPTLVAEPEFTIGLSNTVVWSDESSSGATAYYAECATDAEFTSVVAASDWTAELTFEFAGLTDSQIYYYRVMSQDEYSQESDWSASVFSTQDATAPVSSADELLPVQGALAFDVAFTASDEGSGIASVELFFNIDGGDYAPFGTFTESPVAFIAAADGVYGFYTVANDAVGNTEAIPDDPPDASTTVDTSASDPPTLAAEPEFTMGISNIVSWSDESASGATGYNAECATDAEFTSVVAVSDWIPELTFEFAGLTDGQIYYYRVMSRDENGNESDWSAAVFSTQDAAAPVSSVDALPPTQNDVAFDVAYTVSDAGSGVAAVELFFSVDGGDYTSFGTFTESPVAFTAAGDGAYGFYTIATDAVGNIEEEPTTPPDASTTIDTSASAVPIFAAEPEFTIGLSNTVAWGDESASGATGYYAECATDAEFASVVAASDWITELTFEFGGLTDGQIYYYRVMSHDENSNESDWSASVFSTQDAAAPVSSADELLPVQGALAFDVAYTATDDGSGIAYVELFFNVDGGDYTSFGTFTESPIAFTATGDGVYGFYTIATDAVGHVEAEPDTPPDASTTVDTSASSAPVLVVEPEFTIGLSNAIAWSDESGSGATAYNAECATDAEFAFIVASSDWTAELTFEFTALTDGQIYYYRVMSRDENSNESNWSAAVFSTQDAAAPISSVDELPPVHSTLAFDVAYTATDEVSGIASVELFYSFDGGDYTSFGTFTESPVPFTAAAAGAYGFYTMATDAVGNLEGIPETLPDASTVVEIASMEGTFFIAGDAANTSTLTVELNSAVTLAVEMRFTNDDAIWPETWLTYATEHEWLLAEGPDGIRTVFAQFRDESQAVLELSDEIMFDGALPSPVAGINTYRGHNLVNVSWTHEQADGEGFLVYRGMWYQGTPDVSAYPYFGTLSDDFVPTRPVNHDDVLASEEWELVASVESDVHSFTDIWPDSDSRGIYFYEVFAVNAANNYSLPADENDRATNYILGDMAGANGLVNLPDVGIFAGSYGEYITPDNGNPETDIGPTDDASVSGIPLPDSFINFEDMMILAMAFGYEDPEASDPAVGTPYLSWVRLDRYSYSLRLDQPCSGLKGLNISADLPGGVVASLMAGELLDQQDDLVFLENINSHGLDAGMLVMGAGVDLSGSGEICRVTLSDPDIEIDSPYFVVRDVNNNKMDAVIEEVTEVPVITRFSLAANYPNPFNPMTTISFELPEAQSVRLSIYSIDGRLVSNLVQGTFPAGQHSVVWMGRDDRGQTVASGTYFYRIAAGSFNATRKMVLTK